VHGGLPDDATALAGAKMDTTTLEQQCQDILLRSKSQRPHGHDIMPHQHEKPTWRSMDLSDMTYKVYGPKKPL